MILYINTTGNGDIKVSIKRGGRVLAEKKVKALRQEAEKLLPAVEKLLKANKLKLSDLDSLEVENRGGSFTSSRIGVVTANALAYALGIPAAGAGSGGLKAKNKKFSIIKPLYDREPEITKKKAHKR